MSISVCVSIVGVMGERDSPKVVVRKFDSCMEHCVPRAQEVLDSPSNVLCGARH